MATYTSNYGWTKPSGSDNVDISVLNDNLDDQDSTIHDAFLNMAPPFSESSTYAVDDIVLYTTGLYKCHTAVVTPGSWTGSTNWQVYKLSEGGGGGGGGTSDYPDLTNKPQINGVTLAGNKTTNDLGITASGVGAIPSTDKGANGGVAELDSNGKVPSSQLPSYVDDVLSYSSQSAFPATGETGKIYIAEDTNKTYRWSGSAYAEISASLALGETSSTAYRGDRGKAAYDHSQTTGNPHGTTKSDVGLGNVPNVSTNDQTPTFTQASTRNNIASGEKLSVILGKVQKFFNDLKTVAFSGSFSDLSNKPSINGVTLSGNKTTSDLGITASGVGAIPSTDKGANGGVAELDSNGKVPSSQLPSYVDDVLSYASQSAFPATGETGKIYIAEDTNKTYRWSGSAYAEISASLALGETSSTAYRGDRGKAAYDHSQIFSGNPHGTTKSDVGLGNVPNVSTNNQTPTFTEASTRNNIASGEKLSVIFGKIQKFFNDLKTVAFSGSFSDLINKPENANTFQGTIAEWNQLTTAEKKAYDHASITGTGGGEYNVNKTTGALEQTAGMPSEYPATQVMMSDGTTSVEDALDAVKNNSWVALNNNVKYRVSGGFVYISAVLSNTNNAWVSLGTMPEGLRPSINVYNCCYYRHATTPTFGNLYCNVSGNIQQMSNNDIPNGFLVYPVE